MNKKTMRKISVLENLLKDLKASSNSKSIGGNMARQSKDLLLQAKKSFERVVVNYEYFSDDSGLDRVVVSIQDGDHCFLGVAVNNPNCRNYSKYHLRLIALGRAIFAHKVKSGTVFERPDLMHKFLSISFSLTEVPDMVINSFEEYLYKKFESKNQPEVTI